MPLNHSLWGETMFSMKSSGMQEMCRSQGERQQRQQFQEEGMRYKV